MATQSEEIKLSTARSSPVKRQKITEDQELLVPTLTDLTMDVDSTQNSKDWTRSKFKRTQKRKRASGKGRKRKEPAQAKIDLPKKGLTAYCYFIKEMVGSGSPGSEFLSPLLV